jgi:hypothetical protein
MKGFDSLSDLLAMRYPSMELSPCNICGEPCVKDSCKACQLLSRL